MTLSPKTSPITSRSIKSNLVTKNNLKGKNKNSDAHPLKCILSCVYGLNIMLSSSKQLANVTISLTIDLISTEHIENHT